MKRIFRLGAVIVLAATASAACGSNDSSKDATDTTAAPTPTTGASTPNGSAAKLTLVATDFKFDKASITAQAEQPLILTIKNDGAAEHNLTVEKLDVNEDVEGGKSASSDTITPAAGTYQYHCEYHPSTMSGQLLVS